MAERRPTPKTSSRAPQTADGGRLVAFALSGRDPAAIASALAAASPLFATAPSSLEIDGEDKKAEPIAKWLPRATSLFAKWGPGITPFFNVERDVRLVKVRLAVDPFGVDSVLSLLETIDFEVGSFKTLHDEWLQKDYAGPSFGDMHFAHGWACAFRGAGHARLVSRRFLDHGPWVVHRGANDTTLVRFHDLAAAPAAALEQARPGHERMGISDTGAFLQSDYVYTHDLRGVYLPKERSLRILPVDRDVSQIEMRDACSLRIEKRDDPERPIHNVGFVFQKQRQAEAHLHELWLRELECWSMETGREVRLDTTYAPPAASRPSWA